MKSKSRYRCMVLVMCLNIHEQRTNGKELQIKHRKQHDLSLNVIIPVILFIMNAVMLILYGWSVNFATLLCSHVEIEKLVVIVQCLNLINEKTFEVFRWSGLFACVWECVSVRLPSSSLTRSQQYLVHHFGLIRKEGRRETKPSPHSVLVHIL